jgi:hypothetical protein
MFKKVKEAYRMFRKKKSKTMRSEVEEIQRQNIVKEYKKCYIYPKEYEQRNLNMLDVNGKLIYERES